MNRNDIDAKQDNQDNFFKEDMKNYTIVEKPSQVIIGIKCRTSPEVALQDIPKLWEKFYSEDILDKIPNKTKNDVVALYCDYEGDYTKPYSLVIGCSVNSLDVIPEGMVAKIVPKGYYAVFQAIGNHPETLIETWGGIWKETSFKRTYTGDYEYYGNKFFSSSPQEVDVFIAVEDNEDFK